MTEAPRLGPPAGDAIHHRQPDPHLRCLGPDVGPRIKSTRHNVVVYWDEPGRDLMHSPGGIPVDIGAEVIEPFEDDAELACTSTPAGRFISMLHTGPYSTLGATYDAIYGYCHSASLQTAGPYWEFYGHWNDDPEKLETTVAVSLR